MTKNKMQETKTRSNALKKVTKKIVKNIIYLSQV